MVSGKIPAYRWFGENFQKKRTGVIKMRIKIQKTVLGLIGFAAILITLSGAGSAATGDNLRQITAASSHGPCPVNTGLAFDGTNLLLTCWYNNVIDKINPADGSLNGTVTVAGHSGLMANAWDESRHKLWQCAEQNKVILVDTNDGSNEFKFNSPGCTDGLAYDGADDTLWISPDVSDIIYHYKTDGTLISSTAGLYSKLGGNGNSGIAVGGDKLYLANDGGQRIYEASKDLSSVTLFASFPRRLEDMECDDITFASQGVGAIWSQDAYDRILNAYEIPAGKCKFGGQPPKPRPGIPEFPTMALPIASVFGLMFLISRRKQN